MTSQTKIICGHHQLIRDLVTAIRALREELRDVEATRDWQAQHVRDSWLSAKAERTVQRAREYSDRQAREAEERAGYETYERQQALRALERAYRLDDEYAKKKALAKLRSLS